MTRSRNDFRLTMFIGAFVLTLFFSYAQGIPDFSGLPPGPYCGAQYPALRCCDGRRDVCSAPIVGTLCYCDDFCDRNQTADCCPDYWSHCKGKPVDVGPPQLIQGCLFEGKFYAHGQSIKQNCNKCKCSTLEKKAEMLCETNPCLVEPDIIDTVNFENDRLGWRAENHSEFWGRTLADGMQLRLGTKNPSQYVTKMIPVRTVYDPTKLPKSFDSAEEWKGKIAGVRDQGWCGASWALSTVDVASDRYGIISKGREVVELSAQHLLSCNDRGQQGCSGGYLDKAWLFVRKFGLVDEDCYPWTGAKEQCRFPKRITFDQTRCRRPAGSTRKELYKVTPSYRLGNETDIMHEIRMSGPVQATIKVYPDLFVYKSGIYRHSPRVESSRTGYHSVRIVGWGEEILSYGPPVKYWVVANSWGKDWGENGFFRILRGSNECEIETFVLAVWPKAITY
ncbi:tubulointerstitial nephritis antigen-like isoform X2 [Diprion similis]|uniref:tubulointerstitial nephritis antigen-like isoform X2 n=1 Tax=Diprion similis TaxID=362088 RepID=UPI001EF9B59E|nr:tubulointerstitial nephritis antigen-like isoform X2 [Diprion similis]